MKSVAVFIRARNEAEALAKTLPAIAAQSRPPTEIVVLDNESTDGTADISRTHQARVETISREEFSYGHALNRSLKDTRSEIIIFLSAHSPPTTDRWLERLIEPIESRKASATFGRQVPESGVNHLEEWILHRTFPKKPRTWRRWLGLQRITFSNANAAISRSLLQREPFREDLEFAEDIEWANRVKGQGEDLAYVPAAAIYHSHPYRPGLLERRMESVGRAMARNGSGGEYSSPVGYAVIYLGTLAVDFLFCCFRGYWATIPQIPRYRGEYFRGLRRGLRLGGTP